CSGPSTSSARSSTSSSHLAGTPRQPGASSRERSTGPGSHHGGRPPTGISRPPASSMTCSPAAFPDTEAYANNPIEADHGRLKARLGPMRGLKRDRTARVIVTGYAFVQNLRRGFYDLGTAVPPPPRLAEAFAELALVI